MQAERPVPEQIPLERGCVSLYIQTQSPRISREIFEAAKMNENHTRELTGIDPNSMRVNFSEGVRGAFADLAAALHFSETCSPEMLDTVRDISQGKPLSVYGLILNLPLIAEEVFEHVQATGNQTAAKAWREISSEILESGFTLEKSRERGR